MSRTTRKIRGMSKIQFEDDCEYFGHNDKHSKGARLAQMMNKSWYSYTLPKFFRKSVTKTRRALDKRVLYRELNDEFHREAYSKWNCKDNNSWGYW